eukprot:evm.model.scf_241.7 EVM.evm.TU.scf_241.7   scf_241:68723-91161(+)
MAAVDWDELGRMIGEGDAEGFLQALRGHMLNKCVHFKAMEKGLQNNCLEKLGMQEAVRFLLPCLLKLLMLPPATWVTVLCHLLIELVACNMDPEVIALVKKDAARLFCLCCSPQNARQALKVAQTFDIQSGDVSRPSLIQYIERLLEDKSTRVTGVGLIMHFKGIEQHFPIAKLLSVLVSDGSEGLAMRWATNLGVDYQCTLVEECIAKDRTKAAFQAVNRFGLAARFPSVERTYMEKTIRHLLKKSLWGLAAVFAGKDGQLQETVVRAMAEAGEATMAKQHCIMFNIPESAARMDPKELAADEVATEDRVFIFDLLTLNRNPRFDEVLKLAFWRESTMVLGFSVSGDLAKLSSSYPWVQAFQGVKSILDVQALARLHFNANSIQVGNGGNLAGLSTVARIILGKPLDKSMQVSDWEARPLCPWQLKYAAQDAHVLLLLYKALVANEKGVSSHRIEKLIFDFTAWDGQSQDTSKVKAAKKPTGHSRTQAGKTLSAESVKTNASRGAGADDDLGAGQLRWTELGDPCAPLVAENGSEVCDALKAAANSGDGARCQSSHGRQLFHLAGDGRQCVQHGDAQPRSDCSHGRQACKERKGDVGTSPERGPSVGAQEDHMRMPCRETPSRHLGNDTAEGNSLAAACMDVAAISHQPWSTAAQKSEVPEAVVDRLRRHGLESALRQLDTLGVDRTSAHDSAASLGIPIRHVAKSIAMIVRSTCYLAVLRGDKKVDLRKVANDVGVSRRLVRMATTEECLNLFGFPPGVVPPFGHPCTVTVLVDPSLAEEALLGEASRLSCGSGTHDVVVELTFEQLCLATECRIVDITNWNGATKPVSVSQALVAAKRTEEVAGEAAASVPGTPSIAGMQVAKIGARLQEAAVGGETQIEQAKFLVDSMLGSLCWRLRCLGVDTEAVPALVDRLGLAALTQEATARGRVFLTRNHRLAVHRDLGGVFLLSSDDAGEQIREVASHFGIRYDPSTMFSRCTKCNAANFIFFRPSDTKRPPQVSQRIYKMVEEFWRCGDCNKVYWIGPKTKRALSQLEREFKHGSGETEGKPTKVTGEVQRAMGVLMELDGCEATEQAEMVHEALCEKYAHRSSIERSEET